MKSELKKYDNINADDAQFISDIKAIVYTAKQKAYQAADLFQVAANWLVGKRIIEQEQHGRERAEYGKRIIELASEALTAEYGKGYSATTLRNYRKFYLSFRGLQIQQPLLAEFKNCFLNHCLLILRQPYQARSVSIPCRITFHGCIMSVLCVLKTRMSEIGI